MIVADGIGPAADAVGDALAGASVKVHRGPVPANVIAPPCVLIGVPEATDMAGTLGCPMWQWTIPVLVIAGDTSGRDLYRVTTEIMHALASESIKTVSNTRTWQPDGKPAGLPAIELTAT